jgi:1,2-diacylglycerol 3-alpha-glucosyltransferase
VIDEVISCSETSQKEIRRMFPSKEIPVVHNGVDLSRFRPGLADTYRHGSPQFLFVGNLYSHKRVDELVRGLKLMLASYPTAHLSIVGNGDAYNKLLAVVRQLGMAKFVTFAGSVPHEEMPLFYAASDVYLSASARESYPLPVLESWACGKPAVLSSIPAHQEMLAQCGAGSVYSVGDAKDLSDKAIRVYESRGEFESLALKYARAHGWESIATRIAQIYSLLSR